MGYWEFLLQKKGDQSWLPLDTAQVEILEGRYRIMAHTSLANTPVNVQISQLCYGPQPTPTKDNRSLPKRRTLHRQTATNDSGLMVVMPFTRLGEGSWDVLCASVSPDQSAPKDLASGEPAATWRYGVQLRVVAQDSNDEDDWFADDGSGGILVAGTRAPSPPAPELASTGSALDAQAIAAALDEFQRRLTAGLGSIVAPYRLTLHQKALLGREGETLGLIATVDADLASPALGANLASGALGPDLVLVMRLANPQTSATVALTATPLATATLPVGATLSVTVPASLSTRLLLGEVGLLADDEVVALQGFTVTVDVAALFNAIANQAETDADLGVSFPAEEAEESEAAATSAAASPKPLELAGEGTPARELPILTLPRSSPALPPKIYYPSPHEVTAHQPTLPPVGKPKPTVLPADPEAEPGPTNPPRGLSLPPLAPPPRATDPAASLSGQSPPSARPAATTQPPQLISHQAMGFKQLNLQDRFWHRLNELAVTLQQEALDTQVAALGAPEASALTSPDLTAGKQEPPAFIPFAGEVVIYEDEDLTLSDPQTAFTGAPDLPDLPDLAEPEVEVVTPPVPHLVLPEGDLIAGEPVLVTVRVPFHPNRLYLKVWITDPQTRTLADEPRQVMNLLPNGQGQLEGSLQLTAPLGCLEARFEAIAVDMVTQQESYKATVSRAIQPKGLSSSSLDEFQI